MDKTMTQKISPFDTSLNYGWDFGESGWNVGMDENLLKISSMLSSNIKASVQSLPTNPQDGDVYFLETDNQLYYRSAGTWYFTKLPKGKRLFNNSLSKEVYYDGSSLVTINVDNTSDINKPISTATQVALSSKAKAGVNSDITRLTGLTTPLAINQGGTGAFDASSARASLGLGNSATKNSRAINAELSPSSPVTNYYDGYSFGYDASSNALVGNGNKFNYYEFRVSKDNASQQIGVNGADGSKVNGLHVVHNFGGVGTRGGRHAIEGNLLQGYGGGGATNSDNTDRNYVGVQGQVLSDSGDGGTSGSAKGAYFGSSSYAGISGNAYYVNNVTAAEYNTSIAGGSANRVRFHSGLQIASEIGDRGYEIDTAISVSNLSGLGWRHGLLFGSQNGKHCFQQDSTLLKVNSVGLPSSTMLAAFDFQGVNFTNGILLSPYTNFLDGYLSFSLPNAGIGLGSQASANNPYVNFRSSGTTATYDSRLIAVGGNSTNGNGVFQLDAAQVVAPTVRPGSDNTIPLGTSSFRWSVVYAGTGAINTSDAREKTEVSKFTDKELNAAKQLSKEIGTYRWLESVKLKKDDARIHIGMTVQKAIEIFENNDLNPFAYGFICYDQWEESPEVKVTDVEGNESVVQERVPSGNRYGFRMDELLAFIAVGFEARLSDLESK